MGAGLSTAQVGGCDKTSIVAFSSVKSAPACSFLHSSSNDFYVLQRIRVVLCLIQGFRMNVQMDMCTTYLLENISIIEV